MNAITAKRTEIEGHIDTLKKAIEVPGLSLQAKAQIRQAKDDLVTRWAKLGDLHQEITHQVLTAKVNGSAHLRESVEITKTLGGGLGVIFWSTEDGPIGSEDCSTPLEAIDVISEFLAWTV